MRKTDKKLEKCIVSALTEACEDALELYQGFQWLTHTVNFQSYPDSLFITCVFDTQENLLQTTKTSAINAFKAAIEKRLVSENIKIKDINKRILFDTEEACDQEHKGNWSKRLEGMQNARYV